MSLHQFKLLAFWICLGFLKVPVFAVLAVRQVGIEVLFVAVWLLQLLKHKYEFLPVASAGDRLWWKE